MPSADDILPRLMDACRKAAAAAQETPGARSSYWQLLRAVARNVQAWLIQALIDGCTFPDRPVCLDAGAACLMNFGTTPTQAIRDPEDGAGPGYPGSDGAPPTPRDGESTPAPPLSAAASAVLARLAATFADDHRQSLVYNLEPWLQEQYRDCLDVDFAEELQRELDACRGAMEQAPRRLSAIGLSDGMAREVMAAFAKFKKISASSYQLERDKSSFGDRRAYASVLSRIERALDRAAEELSRSGAGRARVREIFAFWKNESYRAMRLETRLRAVWGGTQLDARVQELARLLAAVYSVAAAKCPDPAIDPRPPSGTVLPEEADELLDRRQIADAFHAVMAQDVIAGPKDMSLARDIRRHGLLCALIVPGTGRVRYGAAVRSARAAPEDNGGGSDEDSPDARSLDPVRRLRYPVNCLVVPHRAPAATLEKQFVEAWFEHGAAARADAVRETLESCKAVCPEIFAPPAGGLPSPAYARQRFLDCLTAYVRWNADGSPPRDEASLPGPLFASFIAWARKRDPRPAYVAPLRYRGWLAVFKAMSRPRRDLIWKRLLGPRGQLDRQLLALRAASGDFDGFFAGLAALPPERRDNHSLHRAKQELESPDLYGDKARRVEGHLRKFMEEDPDLKEALDTLDTGQAIETETQRIQAESLGRPFDYEASGKAVLQRMMVDLLARRRQAAQGVDFHLAGLLHVIEGNDAPAVEALLRCLRPASAEAPPEAGARDPAWFAHAFRPLTEPFPRWPAPGLDDGLPPETDFIYYNLGQMYRRLGQTREAWLAFAGFLRQAEGRPWHGLVQTTREIMEELDRAGTA